MLFTLFVMYSVLKKKQQRQHKSKKARKELLTSPDNDTSAANDTTAAIDTTAAVIDTTHAPPTAASTIVSSPTHATLPLISQQRESPLPIATRVLPSPAVTSAERATSGAAAQCQLMSTPSRRKLFGTPRSLRESGGDDDDDEDEESEDDEEVPVTDHRELLLPSRGLVTFTPVSVVCVTFSVSAKFCKIIFSTVL